MISTLYLRRIGDHPEAAILLNRMKNEGFENLQDIRIETVFRLEGIDQQTAEKLDPLFRHPSSEELTANTGLSEHNGPILEVGYQRAVTDPELPSVLRAARSIGVDNLEWVRIAHRYQFIGVNQKTAQQIVDRYLYNPQVQVLIQPGETWDTLKPRGEAGPVESVSLNHLSDEDLLSLSEDRRLFLNLDQMKALQSIADGLGRDLTDAELEMFAQTWSDHCFHTTWKSLGLLKSLWDATTTIDHPLVLSVFEDNAGAVEFYDGWALTIKGETHNSPSAVSPYGGIMTKHGGVIRDTLGCGQGAKPIGGSTVMGLGDPLMDWKDLPKGALHPKTILVESIRGTANYCNPMGIPMMFPIYKFHPGYTGKCLALGHSIGILPAERAQKGHPKPGDIAILVGGLTGRDGLHGATVSSSSMTSETATVDAAHVQIGHPIEERKFMEAIPVLRDRDCLRAITDLGAAGLSSAGGEMGSETGIWINLAGIDLKTEGMHPWEIWISESQERMLLCVPPEKVDEALSILDEYEVPASLIGKFTGSQRCQVIYDEDLKTPVTDLPVTPELTGQVVVDLDFTDLRKGCPLPDLKTKEPDRPPHEPHVSDLESQDDWKDAIHAVLSHNNICDQQPAGHQFDNTVQGIVSISPYGGKDCRMPNDIWAATPIYGKPYAALASVAFNPLLGDVNPAGMAGLMVVESISRLVAAGADPADVVLCDNFYTPRVNDEIAWDLKSMVDMCCDLSRIFGTPFISGKDSSSGTFISEDGQRLDIPPTLAVMALGRLPDIRNLIDKPFRGIGQKLYLIGPTSTALGGSVFLDTRDEKGTTLPGIDPDGLKAFWSKLRTIQKEGILQAGSAIADGGLIRRIFEMCLGGGLGCTLDLHPLMARLDGSAEAALFGEMIGAMIIAVNEQNAGRIETDLNGIPIGNTMEDYQIDIKGIETNLIMPMPDLTASWERPFREEAL